MLFSTAKRVLSPPSSTAVWVTTSNLRRRSIVVTRPRPKSEPHRNVWDPRRYTAILVPAKPYWIICYRYPRTSQKCQAFRRRGKTDRAFQFSNLWDLSFQGCRSSLQPWTYVFAWVVTCSAIPTSKFSSEAEAIPDCCWCCGLGWHGTCTIFVMEKFVFPSLRSDTMITGYPVITRWTGRIRVLLWLVVCGLMAGALGWPTEGEPAGRATVKRDGVSLYAQMATSSEVVTTLQRGAVVMLDFALTGPEGAWCYITMGRRTKSKGYVRCEDLEQEPVPSWQEAPAQSSATAQLVPRGDAARQRREVLQFLQKKYNAFFWAEKLGFTRQQREQLRDLAERSGWAECQRKSATLFSKYSLGSLHEYPDKGVDNLKKAWQEWAPDHVLCLSRRAEFWMEFPRTMTREQQAVFEELQGKIPDVPYLTE